MPRPRSTLLVAALAPLLLGVGAMRCGARAARDTGDPAAIIAAQADPLRSLVILGNSAAGRGVDADALDASLVWFPASRSAVWLAAVQNGILPHRPVRIVLVAPLWHMVDAHTSADDLDTVSALGGARVPALAERLALRTPDWRDGLRTRLVDATGRAASAWIAWWLPSRRLSPADRLRQANDAMAGRGDREGAAARYANIDLEPSFLPEIIAVARSAGVEVDVVAFPVPDTSPAPAVPPPVEAALIQEIQASGARFLDLRGVALPAGAWVDNVHLTDAGRNRFTDALARAMRGDVVATAATGGTVRLLGVDAPGLELSAPLPRPVPFQPAQHEVDAPAHVGRIEVRWARKLTSAALLDALMLPHCSPLQLTDRGQPLPDRDAESLRILNGEAGAWRHMAAGVLFAAPDGGDPTSPGRFAISLDPSRRCRHARWIYPGDQVTLRHVVPAPLIATTVELGGVLVAGASDALRVTARCDGQPCLDATLPPDALADAALRLDPPATQDFSLSITNANESFYLMTGLSLSAGSSSGGD